MSDPSVPRRRPLVAVALVAVLLVVGAAACSSDKGSSSSHKRSSSKSTASTTSTTTDASKGNTGSPSTTTTTKPKAKPDNTAAGYVDALVKELASVDTSNGGLAVPEADARCLAQKWVDIITVAGLKSHKVTAEQLGTPGFEFATLDLSQPQADAMVDSFAGCNIDIYEKWLGSVSETLTKKQAACVKENLSKDQVHKMLAGGLRVKSDDPTNPLQTEMSKVGATCKLAG